MSGPFTEGGWGQEQAPVVKRPPRPNRPPVNPPYVPGLGIFDSNAETQEVPEMARYADGTNYHPAHPEELTDDRERDIIEEMRRRVAEHDFNHAAGRPAVFLPEVVGPARPPWNGFDTFLRRGVMVAAFAILWTAIVVGVLAAVGVARIATSDPQPSVVEQTEVPPGIDLFGTDAPCIGEVC